MTSRQVLELGTDQALRHKWFVPQSYSHPAKLHLGLLQWIVEKYTRSGDTLGDPMAGIGGLLMAATLQRDVVAREIEPRWLAIAHENAAHIIREAGMFAGQIDVGQADARRPWGWQADHLIFSPPYGNLFVAREESRVMGDAQILARLAAAGQNGEFADRLRAGLKEGSRAANTMAYGDHPDQIGHLRRAAYWQAMAEIYAQAGDALRPGGYMILIIKDHVADHKRVEVVGQTVGLCESLGFSLAERHARKVWPLSFWQRRRKERGETIVEEEDVLVFRRERAK